MIEIDGAFGEGGGQIVRSSLCLSLMTRRGVRIRNIRAKRKNPGLSNQHLTAVQAAAQVGEALVSGAELGSTEIAFEPKGLQPGEYSFAVGTAGSTTLVLQTVLPALLTASGPSRLVLTGGTHNPFAPPFDYLLQSYLPLVNQMGPQVDISLHRYGFYPAGGGQIELAVEPCVELKPLHLMQREQITAKQVLILLSSLPDHIAEREQQLIQKKLGWDPRVFRIERVDAQGPGNVVMAWVHANSVTTLFTAFGQPGVRAEAVANKVVQQVRAYLKSDVPIEQHLADQLILPMALAGGGAFRTLELSQHTQTHIEVIRRFLDVSIEVSKNGPRDVMIRVGDRL